MRVRTRHEHVVELEEEDIFLALGHRPPDLDRAYAATHTMVPQRVTIRWRSEGDGPWKWEDFAIVGPRRLKSGGVGRETFVERIHNYYRHELPSWVTQLIERFAPGRSDGA